VLSRSIMGLLPSTAVLSGSVKFAGQEVLGLDAKQLRHLWGREMSMVFQNPMVSLNPVMKVGRQIIEPLQIHLGMGRTDARATAIQLLRDVRIPEPERRLDQYPHELSGGMRQRVMIAIALACGPTLLFADEPTTALDVTVQAQILELIGEQRRDRNMSVILVTHDLGVVAGHTDEVAVMYGGRLVEKAPTKTLFADMKMPYTKSLMRSIPKIEDPSHSRLFAIPGRPPDLVHPPRGCRFAPRCAYARQTCTQEEPPLTPATSPGHVYACWYPVGSPEFEERDAEIVSGLTVGTGTR
jgi:peptide/nickel transport system ATP-binding protein